MVYEAARGGKFRRHPNQVGAFMERTIRCTVCTWRGTSADAERAPRVRPSQIPQAMEVLQGAYADVGTGRALFGGIADPPCPLCGHHTTKAHRRVSSRPTAL